MRPPRATLRILHLPHIGRDVKRFEVDCRYSTTGLTSIPGGSIELHEDCLILAAAYAHQERCGACDVSDVLDRGDQQMRQLTEELWPNGVYSRCRDGWWVRNRAGTSY